MISQTLQDGTLAASMKKVTQSSSASQAVAINEAVKALSKTQTDDLDVIVDQLGDNNTDTITKKEDITNDFLQTKVFFGPQTMETSFLVYRGLINGLLARSAQCQDRGFLGVMAGDGNAILEVCITSDLSAALASEELRSEWKAANYQIMGLVAWETAHDCHKFTEAMATMMSVQENGAFILVICDTKGCVSTWEFNSEHNPGDFVTVNINNQNKKRRKDQSFKIFYLNQAVCC
eukprot:s202_g23.t1